MMKAAICDLGSWSGGCLTFPWNFREVWASRSSKHASLIVKIIVRYPSAFFNGQSVIDVGGVIGAALHCTGGYLVS